MAKREGFIPVHHSVTKQVAEIHPNQFTALEARGWKKGKTTTTTAAPAADEKKG